MGFAIGSARWARPILQICVLESIVYFRLIAGISPTLASLELSTYRQPVRGLRRRTRFGFLFVCLADWMGGANQRRRPGMHTPGGGYGFRARASERPACAIAHRK